MQGFVDLALLCSFSRMVEALGIPRSAKKEVKVSEEKVAEVKIWPAAPCMRGRTAAQSAWHRVDSSTGNSCTHGTGSQWPPPGVQCVLPHHAVLPIRWRRCCAPVMRWC